MANGRRGASLLDEGGADRRQWWSSGFAVALRTNREVNEGRARAVSGEAAGRRPLQAGQRAAWSGRSERVADTRWPVSVVGRP